MRWTDGGTTEHTVTASTNQTVIAATFAREHRVDMLVLDGDGEVNGFDLTELLVAWGYTGSCSDVDLDLDGYVTSADIALLLNSWGSCN